MKTIVVIGMFVATICTLNAQRQTDTVSTVDNNNGSVVGSSSTETDFQAKHAALVARMRSATSNDQRSVIAKEMRELRKARIQSKRAAQQASAVPVLRQTKQPSPTKGTNPSEESRMVHGIDGSVPAEPIIDVSQTVYHIPFASSANTIELTVSNTASSLPVSAVSIRATDAPSWITLTPDERTVSSIAAGAEATTTFSFSVDRTAPINTEQKVLFTIMTSVLSGAKQPQRWMKQIRIVVDAPERFELYQNSPNPFNPSTVISYDLPRTVPVKLTVYDVLGRELITLVDGIQQAGHQTVTFDASNLPSGVYFYRLQAGSYSNIKKMVMLK